MFPLDQGYNLIKRNLNILCKNPICGKILGSTFSDTSTISNLTENVIPNFSVLLVNYKEKIIHIPFRPQQLHNIFTPDIFKNHVIFLEIIGSRVRKLTGYTLDDYFDSASKSKSVNVPHLITDKKHSQSDLNKTDSMQSIANKSIVIKKTSKRKLKNFQLNEPINANELIENTQTSNKISFNDADINLGASTSKNSCQRVIEFDSFDTFMDQIQSFNIFPELPPANFNMENILADEFGSSTLCDDINAVTTNSPPINTSYAVSLSLPGVQHSVSSSSNLNGDPMWTNSNAINYTPPNENQTMNSRSDEIFQEQHLQFLNSTSNNISNFDPDYAGNLDLLYQFIENELRNQQNLEFN